jgi:mRNA deadenylase 3'-5' endonuclease subunit Ccr4
MKKQVKEWKPHKYHSQERASERYNKEYTKKDIREIEKKLREGEGIFVREANGEDKDIVYLKYNHIPLKICYNYVDNKVVTILPFDVDEYVRLAEN